MGGRVAVTFRASYTCWPGWALTHKGTESMANTSLVCMPTNTHTAHTQLHPRTPHTYTQYASHMHHTATYIPHTHTHMLCNNRAHRTLRTHGYTHTQLLEYHTQNIYPTTHKHTTDTPHWSHASMPHTRVYTPHITQFT